MLPLSEGQAVQTWELSKEAMPFRISGNIGDKKKLHIFVLETLYLQSAFSHIALFISQASWLLRLCN
jgi:hypothetical protein